MSEVLKGLGVTVYGGGAARALPYALPLIARIDPSFVVLHTWPDGDDASLVQALRKQKQGRRVWFSPGANSLAALSENRCAQYGREWVRFCANVGAECLLLNIEGPSAKGLPGWVLGKDLEQNKRLAGRLTALLTACVLPGVSLGVTSHDWLLSHPLPEIAYTHPGVSLVLPQVYPSVSTRSENFTSREGMRVRLSKTKKQWDSPRASVRPDLRPGMPGWGVYGQLWGQVPGACASLMDSQDLACGWELPFIPRGTTQEKTLRGLCVIAECRRRYGEGKGAVLRAQIALDLPRDGLAGPMLARELRLPWLDGP